MSLDALILTVPLALAAATVLFLRPLWGFVLVMLFFGLEQLIQSYFGVFRDNPAMFNFVVAVAAAVGVAVRVSRRDPVLSGLNNAVTYLVFAQFTLWLVAMVYSPVPDVAWGTFLDCWPYLVLLLIVTPLLVGDLADAHDAFMKVMIAGALICVLIMFNPSSTYYAGRLSLDLGMAMEQGSRFGNVLALAELGGTVALIAAMIVPWRQRSLFTVIRIAAFVIGLGLAIGSGSRGQVLATVVAGILFYPLARRINNLRSFFLTAFGLMTLAVVVYVTFLLFIGYQNRTRWDIGFMLRDIGGRFDMCWAFMQAWYASPAHWLFGLGTNAWITVSGDSGIHGNYVHNIAIEVLCEHGLVGGAIFAATTVLVCIGGLKMWRMHRDNPPLRSAAAILLAISAFSLFNSLKAGNITSMMPFYFWLVLAKIAKREEIMAAEQDADFAGDSLEPESGYEELPEYALAR
jgi:hypothetical protein